MKKVKILKHVGPYEPEQIIEVDDVMAANLCHVGILDDGITQKEHRRAILLEEFEAIQEVDISELSVGEVLAMGRKNIVESKEYDATKGFKDNEAIEKKTRRAKG